MSTLYSSYSIYSSIYFLIGSLYVANECDMSACVRVRPCVNTNVTCVCCIDYAVSTKYIVFAAFLSIAPCE